MEQPDVFYGDLDPVNRFSSWWESLKGYVHVGLEREEMMSIIWAVEAEDEGLDAESRDFGSDLAAFHRETYLAHNLPAHLSAALARAAEEPDAHPSSNSDAGGVLEEARAASFVLLATLESALYDLICSFMYPDVEEEMCDGLTADHPTCATTLIRRLRAKFVEPPRPPRPREAGNREAGTAMFVDHLVAIGQSGGDIDKMMSLVSDFQRDAPSMCSTLPPLDDLMAQLQLHLLRDSQNPVLERMGIDLLAEDTTPSLQAVGAALERAMREEVTTPHVF
jgi:hypothetical protein